MTARARLMLDALEDGCGTRAELWAHAGRFYLTNNAAADLRRAGIPVEFVRGDHHDDDRYVLADDRLLGERTDASPGMTAPAPTRAVPLAEQPSGQYALDFEAAAA